MGGAGKKFRAVMYEELNPLVMMTILACIVVIALMLLQRVCTKRSEMCSPLGFILSLATMGAGICLLAISAVSTLYASDAMAESVVSASTTCSCINHLQLPTLSTLFGAVVSYFL
jgi:hypothetical protein